MVAALARRGLRRVIVAEPAVEEARLVDGVEVVGVETLEAAVETVRAGDPFVADNAYRLQAIAWFLLALFGVAAAAIYYSGAQSETVSILRRSASPTTEKE